MTYNCISCGTYSDKAKCCFHCKYYCMWGVGGGDCCSPSIKPDKKYGRYKFADNRCKYYKRNSQIFDKNGKVKNKELYDELFI